jgi:bifunctional DNA primase/polymerase-like protein/AAA domain-containing protein/primase-like protein
MSHACGVEDAASDTAVNACDSILARAARDLAAHGLPVFPLYGVLEGRCTCTAGIQCSSPGKHPRTARGVKDATADALKVQTWWSRWPNANIGVATGGGRIVLDVDGVDGEASLERLVGEHGQLPATVEVKTGNGRHLWFAGDGRNSVRRVGQGLDVRAGGGYVVVPPSCHVNGEQYLWLPNGHTLGNLPSAPRWINARNDSHHEVSATDPGVGLILQGRRNQTLTSIAGSMRRQGLAAEVIASALLSINATGCKPPLPEAEVGTIAESIGHYPTPMSTVTDVAVEAMTARELCALPDPPGTDELLGPLVRRGHRTLVAAHAGEGKTTLVMQMLRALVQSVEFLGWHGAGGCRALVIDLEQNLKSIKRKLREAGLADCEQVDYVRVPDGLALDQDAEHRAALVRLFETGGYDVVVLDPLYKAHQGDSNAERETVDLMRYFDGWRARYGFALIVLTHCRKPSPGARFSAHDIFGSTAFVRGAEIVLGLQRVSNGFARFHFFKDRDGDLPVPEAWGLLFDRDDGFLRDPQDGKKEPTTVELVRSLLDETPWMTKQQLIDSTGRKKRSVEDALRTLRAIHRVLGNSSTREYALPENDGTAQ